MMNDTIVDDFGNEIVRNTTVSSNEPAVEYDADLIAIVEKALGTLVVMSPYKLSKIASVVCERTIQGPMIYQYCNKGYIKLMPRLSETDKKMVSREEATKWLLKFASKNA